MGKGSPEEKRDSSVKIGTKTKEKCPHCGCRLINLMEIDGRDFRLDFLEIDGVIKAKCCPSCMEYSDGAFCRYTLNVESELILGKSDCTENYLKDSEAYPQLSTKGIL